jgi:hypothetical protein
LKKKPKFDLKKECPDVDECSLDSSEHTCRRVVWRRLRHAWYDEDNESITLYHGSKVEKLKRKSGGTSVIIYWDEEDL